MAWYIDGPEDLSIKKFIKIYAPVLDKILEDPSASILITDRSGCPTYIARYLKNHGYRNCVVYHLGNKPRHNIGNFRTKGGFISWESIEQKMKSESQHIFQFEE